MKAQGWITKLASLFLTFGLLYFLIAVHNVILLVSAFIVLIFFGEYLIYTKPNSNSTLLNIAWGLVYGSVTFLVLAIATAAYVSYLYNN